MRYFIFTILFTAFARIEVYSQARTDFKIDDNEMMQYVSERYGYMKFRVGTLPGYKINAYADKNLRKGYSREEARRLGGSCEWITIPHPLYPDDPYQFVDTLVCTPFDPTDISSWVLRSGKNFRSNKWKDVKSVGITIEGNHEYGDSGKLVKRAPDSMLYYIHRTDFESLLLPEEKRLLQAYLDYIDPAANEMDSVIISDALLKTFINTWYDSLSAPVYRKAIAGQVPLYYNDSLTGKMTWQELENLGGDCFEVMVPNPVNPEDPYDMVDTVVCKVFLPEELQGLSAGYDWISDDVSSRLTLRAVGFLYQPLIAEIELPAMPMFWLSAGELKKAIPQNDWLLMTDIFNFHLVTSIEKGYYWGW